MPAGTGLTCAGSSASRCNATPLTPRWLRSWRGCWTVPDELLPALHQEQRRRRQRVLLGVAGAALGISFAMAALAAVALHQRGVANDRLRQAQYQQSMSLSALADLEGHGRRRHRGAVAGLARLSQLAVKHPSNGRISGGVVPQGRHHRMDGDYAIGMPSVVILGGGWSGKLILSR